MNTKYTQSSALSIENAQSSIGGRLRLFLRIRNWTIKELSQESGIPYRSLQNYLSDERKPNAEHLMNLFKVGLDPTWIISGDTQSSIFSELRNDEKFSVFLADRLTFKIISDKISNIIDTMQSDYFNQTGDIIKYTTWMKVHQQALHYSLTIISSLSQNILELRKAFSIDYIFDLIIWPVVLEKLKSKFSNADLVALSNESSGSVSV